MKGLGFLINVLAVIFIVYLILGPRFLKPSGKENMTREASSSLQTSDYPNFRLESPAFTSDLLPRPYTCDGSGINPPLTFINVPESAKSLALTLDDPDAPRGPFHHWVVFNMPTSTTVTPENGTPPGIVGRNSAGQESYYPPCPPSGEHRYIFTLYALDAALDLGATAGQPELLEAMKGHLIATATLSTRYRKK